MGVAGEAKDRAVGAKDEALSFWSNLRRKQPWLDHAVRAWQQLGNTNGSLLAGALTFVSFLALIPLILLGVSIAAFVLRSHPHTLNNLLKNVRTQAPGGLGDTLKKAITTAIDKRAGLGVIGLVGVLLTGLGWISNLRTATEQVWQHPPLKRSFVQAKIADLIVLAVLGAGLILSVALTVAGSALTGEVTKVVSFGGSTVTSVLTRVLSIGVAVLADMVILGFLLFRLPRASVPRGTALRAAILAAVGFEILKLVGTYYIKSTTKNPAVATFGPIIGVLLFLNLVFRFLLYCTAWTATGTPDDPLVRPLDASTSPRTASDDSVVAGIARVDEPAPRPRSPGLAVALVLGALGRRRGK